MASEIGTFIELVKDVEKCLVFDRQTVEDRKWVDPVSGIAKSGKVYVLHTVLEDNKPVDKTYNVMSRRHAEELEDLRSQGLLLNRPICILRTGEGYLTRYSIRIGPG